jgi:hypothetical protein
VGSGSVQQIVRAGILIVSCYNLVSVVFLRPTPLGICYQLGARNVSVVARIICVYEGPGSGGYELLVFCSFRLRCCSGFLSTCSGIIP